MMTRCNHDKASIPGDPLVVLARRYGSTTPVNRKQVHRVAQNYTSTVKNGKREVDASDRVRLSNSPLTYVLRYR
jgi:hypothetical protein